MQHQYGRFGAVGVGEYSIDLVGHGLIQGVTFLRAVGAPRAAFPVDAQR